MHRRRHYLTREGVTESYSTSAIEIEFREEDGLGSAWFDTTGRQLTEWSPSGRVHEHTPEGLRQLADVEDGGATLEAAYFALGISHRPRVAGERGKMYSRTLVDAETGEPIATMDASDGWDFVRWCAQREAS